MPDPIDPARAGLTLICCSTPRTSVDSDLWTFNTAARRMTACGGLCLKKSPNEPSGKVTAVISNPLRSRLIVARTHYLNGASVPGRWRIFSRYDQALS
jgi:hypothetical protein